MARKIQSKLIENKAHHHAGAVILALACSIIILMLSEHSATSNQNSQSALIAAEAHVTALKTEVLTAQSRYTSDKQNEGFFRTYLWSDSPIVKADLVNARNLELQYEMAQEDACKLEKERDCSVVVLDAQGRTGVVVHRIKVVAAIASVFLTFVIILIAIAGSVLTFPTVLGPILIFGVTAWYIFH